MAAALQSFVSLRSSNPEIRAARVPETFYRLYFSSSSRIGSSLSRGSAVSDGFLQLSRSSRQRRRLGCDFLSTDRRILKLVSFAAQSEDSNNELDIEKNDSQEEWQQMLESFKQEAEKIRGVSQEAYDLYSKKMIVILKENSEKLKIQGDKARRDLTILAIELGEDGKEYLSAAAKNPPDSVKDIVETFSSSPDEWKNLSAARDFYLGIPYGTFLAIGGFLSFMLTGSISAIRFGLILGSALLALSVASLRSWRSGHSSTPLLKGQAAIATIIFIREWRLLIERLSFLSFFMTLISGAMLVFYVYRIIVNDQNKGPNLENGTKN